ncbi:unnamed protein product [Cladocopium goreaui]|uniref:2'-phosphotransferase n=1 Tax=Cladocopium goreaui TaxID=2562237 RepID=A0A9P1CMB1_9DINO|nr:unnamed protein product [Cladocopium goreaui]
MSVWEELWARFTEELRALDRRARREMQDESPSFDRLRFFATSPGENGEPWLRLPQTFDLQAPGEYFQTDIVPRQQRMLDRACWSMALKRPSPLTGGRAGAEDIGGPDKAQPSAPNPRNPRAGGKGSAPGANTAAKEPAPLLGNALTSKEAGRSMDHRPKDKDGKYLCWDYFSHRKCNKGKDCPHSHHGNAPRWDTLDWSVQMQLLRRGGHPARPKLKGDQVDATIESIRKEQAQKLESNIQEGKRAKEMAKRTGGPPPQDASTQYREDTRAGWTPAPAALANFAATDMEDPLARLMTGEAAASWTLDHAPPAVRTVTYRESPDSAEIQAKRHCMDEIDSSGLLPDLPQPLGTYLRNRLTAVNDRAPTAHDVQEFLEDAIREGSAELASEATDYLHNHPDTHVGSREGRGALGQFSVHGFDGYSWATFRWRDGDHAVYDYGDQLAPVHPELQPLQCPKPETEPRQCFYLHVAAGLLAHTANRVPALSEVRLKAAALQEETFRLALACAENLGPEPDICTQAEEDLRIFVHDALFFGHDKDYRCLAAFPPAEAAEVSFCLVRMDAWNRISCEVIQGAHSRSDPKSLIWLLVHQGHMRLLLPEIATSIPDNVRIVTAAGWEVHLEAAAEHGARHRARAPKPCPRCQDDPMRRTGVTTGVFGLYPFPAETAALASRAGASRWEVDEPPFEQWTREDLQELFPGQRLPEPGQPLHFLGVYVDALGWDNAPDVPVGAALFVGPATSRSFCNGRVRSLLRAALTLLRPRHVWVLLPRTGLGSWPEPSASALEPSAHQHLQFTLELGQHQLNLPGHFTLVHPLTSPVWKDPAAIQLFSTFHRVRLPASPIDPVAAAFCGPSPAAYLCLKTTSSALAIAAGSSSSELPHSSPLASVLFDGAEACFAPGAGLRRAGGPLAPPLDPAVERATKEYLDFFRNRAFSAAHFASAAQKGSALLAAAGGWQEALRAIRRVWVQERGDHMSGLHSDFFEGLVHPAVLERARHVAIWGVEASADLEETTRTKSAPHPSLKEHLDEAAAQLWDDASKGRSLLCFDTGKGLEGVVSVPMARVPKMNPDRTVSDKGRVIWDATPVNRYCHKSRHPPALQPRHQEVARAILWWKLRYPRIRILLSKKDVSEAFKWIPVRLEDSKLFAADLPAEYSNTQEGITIVYGFLTFGWCGAPGEYMHYAWVIKLAHEAFAPENSRWEDTVPYHSFVLMDDTVLIEPEIGLRPETSVALTEHLTRAVLGDASINEGKDWLEGRLETRKLIWGLIYDTQTNTRSLPSAKLEKAYHLLHLPDFDSGCTHVPLRLIQELRGNQQFWLAVLPGLSPYLGCTNDLLGPADPQGLARAKGDEKQQRETWNRFWEAIELQRLLVDVSASWEVRFTHPLNAALSVSELLSFPGMQSQVIWACGDATPERVAAVDWHGKVAIVEPASLVWQRIRHFCGGEEGTDEGQSGPDSEDRTDPDDGLLISLAELLAVVSLACTRWTAWRGKIVIYAGDNQNVISWLEKRQAGPPAARFLLQLLAALETVGGFRLHASYVRTYHNQVADSLTRAEAQSILEEHELRKVPFSEVLLGTLDKGWTRRALLWDGMDHGDKAAALQLGLRRHPEGPNKHPFPLKEGLVCAEIGEAGPYEIELVSKGLIVQRHTLEEASRRECAPERYMCAFSTQAAEARWLRLLASPNLLRGGSRKESGSTPSPLMAPEQPQGSMLVEAMDTDSGSRRKAPASSTLSHARRGTRYDTPSTELALGRLMGTPRSLALVAGRWASALGTDRGASGCCFEPEQSSAAEAKVESPEADETPEACFEPGNADSERVGICSLPWEDKARAALMAWLQSRGWEAERRTGGTKRRKKKEEDWNIQFSKALASCLRHEAGSAECHITEDGWVTMDHLRGYPRAKLRWPERYITEEAIRAEVEGNLKQRFVVRTDESTGRSCVAAWSGHTIPGVAGPGVLVKPSEVPALLVHGSYHRHTASIVQNGLSASRRMIHLVDPERASNKWRADLETRVPVDTRKAQEAGVSFRVTGNDVWLADADIPPEALGKVVAWTTDDFWFASESTRARARPEQASPVPFHKTGTAGAAGSGSRLPAWPSGSLKQEQDLKEGLAQTATGLASAVAGLKVEEGEKEVQVDPRTLEPTVVTLSEADWNVSEESDMGPDEPSAPATRTVKKESDQGSAEAEIKLDPGTTEREERQGVAEARPAPGTTSAGSSWKPTLVKKPQDPGPGEGCPKPGRLEPKHEEGAEPEGLTLERVKPPPAEESEEDSPIGLPARYRPVGRVEPGQPQEALAEADTANWENLQSALKEAEGSGGEKAALVEDLERLTQQRKEAAEGIKEALEAETQRVRQCEEEDSRYLETLDSQGEYMRKLERFNPARPSKTAKVLSSDRLTSEIEAGVSVWVARRREKARLRAQAHREGLQRGATSEGNTKHEPIETPEGAEEARQQAARREIAEFREHLREQGGGAVPKYRRAPDSRQRKATKKRNRAAKEAETRAAAKGALSPTRNDDAERDTNHAIAHFHGQEHAHAVVLAGARLPPFLVSEGTVLLGLVLLTGVLLGLAWGSCRRSLAHSPVRTDPLASSSRGNLPRAPHQQEAATGRRTQTSSAAEARRRGSRGSTSSPAPDNLRRRSPHPSQRGLDRRRANWHKEGCSRTGASTLWLEACKDCVSISEVDDYQGSVEATWSGARWHKPQCGHTRGRNVVQFAPCPECARVAAPSQSRGSIRGPRRNNDAERDTNHAIAHWFLLAIALGLYLAGVCWHWGEPCGGPQEGQEKTRVGGPRGRKVRFEPYHETLAAAGSPTSQATGKKQSIEKPRRLGSPQAARAAQGATGPMLGLRLKCKEDYHEEAIRVALDRLAISTRRTYESQLKWWRLFCARRGVSWILTGPSSNKTEETLLIDFLLHCACNEGRAPGTLKLRLAAVRSVHLSLGMEDPLEGRGRVAMALAGLRRRYKVPERRAPVTPRMLNYLHDRLRGSSSSPESVLLWAGICLGFFFLLRASEFLPLGYLPLSRHLKGHQVLLYSHGKLCTISNLVEADEVRVKLVGSKTKYNLETNRNHYRTENQVCPVESVVRLFQKFPERYLGGCEATEPLFRTPSGEGVQREAIQMLLREAACQCGVGGTIGSHSLRFGGASALWTAFKDASVVRRPEARFAPGQSPLHLPK